MAVREFRTIAEFVAFLGRAEAEVHHAEERGLQEAGKRLVHATQELIGAEDEAWAALAPFTVAEKTRLGYINRITPTDPLYRTGELRISITYDVALPALTIGTPDEIGYFQEFGTNRIPPRPFIGLTMFRDHHHAANLVAGHIVGAMMGNAHPVQIGPEWTVKAARE